LLIERVRLVLLISLVGGTVFTVMEVGAASRPFLPSFYVKAVGLALGITALIVLSRPRAVRHAWTLAIGVVAIAYVLTALSGVLAAPPEYATSAVLFVGAAITTATFVPWGVRAQAATVAIAAATLAAAVWWVDGNPAAAMSDPGAATLGGLAFSLLTAREMNRSLLGHRRELQARRRSEIAVRHVNARLEQRVRERTRELEDAVRLKSEFVATMSHELRTPLNAIMGYADLLLQGGYGEVPPEQREAVARIDHNAAQLHELINSILDLSRLEAGRLTPEPDAVRVPELMRDLQTEVRELFEQTGLRFEWNVDTDLPPLRTDPRLVKTVLKNLIGNAVKFTPRGSVTVGARPRDGGVEISVADTGIGIAADALPIIFERFRQVDSSTTRRFGGVGLGLYIVRRSLDLLGGTIAVQTEVGRGSRFSVWLPAQPSLRSRVGAANSEQGTANGEQ
jgi:signal transduction histidine kinase